MANSGSFKTSKLAGSLYVKFDWNISDIDTAAGTGNFNYSLYCTRDDSATTKYWVYTSSNNYFNINGGSVYKIVSSGGNNKSNPYNLGNGSDSNPYKLYTSDSSFDKTTKTLSGYSDPIKDKKGFFLKVLASGTIPITYDDNGDTSISIDGKFHCYTSSSPVGTISATIVPDRIERYSRGQRSTNYGSSWNKDVFFWKTTNYGQTWTKCNLYRTTNYGSSWTKVT